MCTQKYRLPESKFTWTFKETASLGKPTQEQLLQMVCREAKHRAEVTSRGFVHTSKVLRDACKTHNSYNNMGLPNTCTSSSFADTSLQVLVERNSTEEEPSLCRAAQRQHLLHTFRAPLTNPTHLRGQTGSLIVQEELWDDSSRQSRTSAREDFQSRNCYSLALKNH